jgi:hypothetical protein
LLEPVDRIELNYFCKVARPRNAQEKLINASVFNRTDARTLPRSGLRASAKARDQVSRPLPAAQAEAATAIAASLDR